MSFFSAMAAPATLVIAAAAALLAACSPTALSSPTPRAGAPRGAPLLGWRSWNLFGAHVDQRLIEEVMLSVATKALPVAGRDGRTMSLRALGFADVGLDDGWQECGAAAARAAGLNYHDGGGAPVVNTTRFPDMGAMVDYGHGLGLTVGWYANNCLCPDACNATGAPTCDEMIEMDARAFARYGFDSYKLDGCGGELDLWRWHARLRALSARPDLTIENCHWGWQPPALPANRTAAGCPWSHYRTSGDVRASFASVMANLFTVFPLQERDLSGPGCWAYPDMLEVGVEFPGYRLSAAEARSHYAAWAIVSSPLILSFDPRDDAKMREVWPLVSNTDILAVQQAYAGDSGGRFAWSERNVTLTDPFLAANNQSVSVPEWVYLQKPVPGDGVAVLLMNAGGAERALRLEFAEVPRLNCSSSCHVRDVFNQSTIGVVGGGGIEAKVGAHDSFFAVLTPAAGRAGGAERPRPRAPSL